MQCKFKEKSLKDPNAKEKSKLPFNELQRKSSNSTSGASYQAFRGSPLPQFSGDWGHFVRARQKGLKN